MNAATVEEASTYARELVRMRSRGSDKAIAIDKVARECGVARGAVWALLYRKPKRVWADVLLSLRAGYLAAQEAQLQAIQHDIEVTKKVSGAHDAVALAAQAMVAAAYGEPHQ